MSLNELRKEIDHIDAQVIELLNRRAQIAQEIGQQKAHTRSHYFTPEREQTVYKRVLTLNKGPLPPEAVRAIYREIISAAIALEKPLTVAYLGPPGTFSHQAGITRFGTSAGFTACETIPDIFTQVERGLCD